MSKFIPASVGRLNPLVAVAAGVTLESRAAGPPIGWIRATRQGPIGD